MLRASCLILYLVAVSHQVSITDFAVPSTIKAGENAELQCRYAVLPNETEIEYVKWWRKPLNAPNDKKEVLYQRLGGLIKTVSNIVVKENDTIELQSLQPEHSGTYICEVCDSNLNEVLKQHTLIVYTEGNSLHLNITEMPDGPDEDEDDEVRITCEATDVAPEPELLITISSADETSLLIDETVSEPVSGLYNITATAIANKKDVVGANIRCELSYKNVSHEEYTVSEFFYESDDSATSLSYTLPLFVIVAGFTQLVNLR